MRSELTPPDPASCPTSFGWHQHCLFLPEDIREPLRIRSEWSMPGSHMHPDNKHKPLRDESGEVKIRITSGAQGHYRWRSKRISTHESRPPTVMHEDQGVC